MKATIFRSMSAWRTRDQILPGELTSGPDELLRRKVFGPAGSRQGSRCEVSAARVRGFGPRRSLSDAEIAAVDDGIDAMENLLGKLADVPTPAGRRHVKSRSILRLREEGGKCGLRFKLR